MTKAKRAEARTVARRKGAGVRKEDLKRGLDQPTVRGRATSAPPSVAAEVAEARAYVAGEHKPPETLEEFKQAYRDMADRRDYWMSEAQRAESEVRALRCLLRAAGDALSSGSRYPDDIPF